MDLKVALLCLVLLALAVDLSRAEFYAAKSSSEEKKKVHKPIVQLNQLQKKSDSMLHGMICAPGRTYIKIQKADDEDEEDQSKEEDDGRRTHMNSIPSENESCLICVCSVNGVDEYCSKRPAMNVNECIRMSALVVTFKKNRPFDHERSLSQRIRRDYIYHKDEIPYHPEAKCVRGQTYYTNQKTKHIPFVNITWHTKVQNLLDYELIDSKEISEEMAQSNNRGLTPNPTGMPGKDGSISNVTEEKGNPCYFCICSVHGLDRICMIRDVYFCDYYKERRNPAATEPLVGTNENSFITNEYKKRFGNRYQPYFRHISFRVRRTMDDGIFDFIDSVGTALNPLSKCVPFISQYTDCTEENRCSGCTRCHCTREGQWSCEVNTECGRAYDTRLDDRSLDAALEALLEVLKPTDETERASQTYNFKSRNPVDDNDDGLLDETADLEKDLLTLLSRKKRSVDSNIKPDAINNGTIKFYHTVDEVNEDVLKKNNSEGTIEAKKFDTINLTPSRRVGQNVNSSALHIEYNDHTSYNPHEHDNKIDSNDRVHKIFNNLTEKDKDVSKIVVNELKKGIEYIGDKTAPVTSNITFTPEKDTLTAMAFIAGNLLNKLWSIEKESDDPMETEILKHEKIADLVDLFKVPLTMRQALFLKSALEKISTAVDKHERVDNATLCQSLANARQELQDASDCDKRKMIVPTQKSATENAVSKIGDVLKLAKQFETLNVDMNKLKHPESVEPNTKLRSTDDKDDKDDVDQFSNILDKITKLLIPDKKRRKEISKKIKNQKVEPTKKIIEDKLKDLFNVEPGTVAISSKDELLFSLLNKMENSPKCLLDLDSKIDPVAKKVGGEILLNLSEFLKVKSLVDLLKLTETKPETTTTTTEIPVTSSRRENQKEAVDSNKPINTVLEEIKNKLKGHLRSIIQDIAELQNAKGANKNTDFKISDVLPCVYKLLKDGPDNKAPAYKPKVNKIETSQNLRRLFDTLKTRGKFPIGARRFDDNLDKIPKSAVVWERTIKSIDENENQPATRRHLEPEDVPQFDQLKKLIDAIKSVKPTTKSDALKENIPPSERLVVLKTLKLNAKHNVDLLKNIQKSLKAQAINRTQIGEIDTFLDETSSDLDRLEQMMEHVDEFRKTSFKKEPMRMPLKSFKSVNRDESVKSTKDQLMNNLMRSRIETYLKTKEAIKSVSDNNYKVAQRIQRLIQSKNYVLARNLFKVFVNKPKVKSSSGLPERNSEPKSSFRRQFSKTQNAQPQSALGAQDQEEVLKQMLNIDELMSSSIGA